MHARIVLLPVDGENMVNAAANADYLTEVENQKEGPAARDRHGGAKRVGVAVSDELAMTVRPVTTIERRSWKKLLLSIIEQIEVLGRVVSWWVCRLTLMDRKDLRPLRRDRSPRNSNYR